VRRFGRELIFSGDFHKNEQILLFRHLAQPREVGGGGTKREGGGVRGGFVEGRGGDEEGWGGNPLPEEIGSTI